MQSPTPYRILGIDPGLGITGYGCLDLSGGERTPRIVEAGVLRLSSRAPILDRLEQLYHDLTGLLEELKPELMVVERIFTHYKHLRTSMLMGHARGVVLLAARHQGVATDELAATEVKKAITGNGHASKLQMQRVIMHEYQLPCLPEPSDVADAIAIALTAARLAPGEQPIAISH